MSALPFDAYSEPEKPKPEPVAAVAYRGRMVRREGARYATYRPENHEWRDWLCDRDKDGRLVGKDPMTIPPEILAASGHPDPSPAGVKAVVSRLKRMQNPDLEAGGELPFETPTRLTNIREKVCTPCSSDNLAEVRRCAIYDCPAWAFRMGHNPHNPRRGQNAGIDPFADRRGKTTEGQPPDSP